MCAFNSKQLVINTIERKLGRRLPVFFPYKHLFIRDRWEELSRTEWWNWDLVNIEEMIKIDEKIDEILGLDLCEAIIVQPKEWRDRNKIINENGKIFIEDKITHSRKEIRKDREIQGASSGIRSTRKIFSTEEVYEKISIINEEELIKNGYLDYAKELVKEFGNEKFVYGIVGTPFSVSTGYLGIEGTMLAIYDEPELLECLIQRNCEIIIEQLKAYKAVGVDGIFLEECLTSRDMISKEHYVRFSKPYVERLIKLIRELGMKSIYYLCGDVLDRLDIVCKIGPDCLALEESKKGFRIDMEEVSRITESKMCLVGNIDSVWILEKGSNKELEEEIKKQAEIGIKNNGLIISTGSPIVPGTSIKRLKKYIKFAKEYGSKISMQFSV